jgi:phosphoserine phosphatase RsbU/P
MLSSNTELRELDKYQDKELIKDIIDGMNDWVRVLDRDSNMIYVNKSMADGLESYPIGEKCYVAVGRSSPCENCISRRAVFDGVPHEKEEVFNDKIFSVISSPVKNRDGEIVAVVEVLRDITQMKNLQKKILDQNKKLQEDLSIAKKLQCSLLPKKFPSDKIGLSFIYKPCESLGGDFLDIFKIDEDHVGIYIADVSGHGVSASLLTVFLRSTMNKKTLSPSAALKELYADFNESDFDPNFYITIFYAVIDIKNYTLVYSNAGHNVCPVIFNKDRFEILRIPGIPISNWTETVEYQDNKISLLKDDKIFLYTDGIIEIRNKENKIYGDDRLLDILLNSTQPIYPNALLNKIIDSACEFAGIKDFAELTDDITMALLEVK